MQPKRIKIIEVVPHLRTGGVSRLVIDLINSLSTQHEVTIIVIMPLGSDSNLIRDISPNIKIIQLNHCCNSFLQSITVLPRLWRQIYSLHPDVVHTHLEGFRACLLAILFNWRKTPFFYTIHNEPRIDAGKYFMVHKILFKIPWVHPITISKYSHKKFTSDFGSKSKLIFNGCIKKMPSEEEKSAVLPEITQWRKNSKLLLLNLARISKQKNQIALAEAVKKANINGINVNLVIMGPVEDEEILTKLKQITCEHIHIVDCKNNPLPYLSQCDALILPSLYEGLPIATIEALSLGIPCITTPISGMTDLITDGYNGLISSGTSTDEIKETIIRFYNFSILERQKLSSNALQSFIPYNMTNCTKLYNAVLQGKD